MDEICEKLSYKLSEGAAGGYCIFYEEELLEVLPENVADRKTLEAALKVLTSGKFIDVKYARGNAFCIAFLRPYTFKKVTENAQPCSTENKIGAAIYALLAIFSFAGGMLGALIGAVI